MGSSPGWTLIVDLRASGFPPGAKDRLWRSRRARPDRPKFGSSEKVG